MSSSSTHPQPVSEDCVVSDACPDPKNEVRHHMRGPQNQDSFVSDKQLKSQQGASLSRQMTINELPVELLLTIFSHMNFRELINVVQNVCTYWRKLAHDPHLWYDIVYEIGHNETDEEAIETLKMTTQLRTVILKQTATEPVFRALSENCHELTKLDILNCQPLSPSDVKNLFESCNKLQVLNIPKDLFFDTRFLESLANLKELRALEIKEDNRGETKVELRKLVHMLPHLCEIHLWLRYCNFDDLEYFIKAKKHDLKRLTLDWLPKTGRCIAPLLTLCAGSLESLQLYGIECDGLLNQEGFVALCQLNNLRELALESWPVRPVKNTFSLPFRSGGLSRLQRLHLRGAAINSEVLLAVCQGCPELCELDLHSCPVTDAGCVLLHLLKQLKVLTLSCCKRLRGEAIPRIGKLPALERFQINFMELERLEPGLKHIVHMSNLRSLSLQDCTARGVRFHKFPENLLNLRELHVGHYEDNEPAFRDMCTKIPGVNVYGEISEYLQFTDSEDEDVDEED